MPLTNIIAQVAAFSFSDGRNTITNSTLTDFLRFNVGTDALGKIDTWEVTLFTPLELAVPQFEFVSTSLGIEPIDGGAVIVCTVVIDPFCGEVDADSGRALGQSGKWIIRTPVPLPPSLGLLGLGLVGLPYCRRNFVQR